jgi:Spy/CpxP family protein refolding chaperone
VTLQRLKPWLVLAVIFLAGIATGTALTMAWSSHNSRPPGIRDFKSRWLAHLTERLKLSPDQQEKIEPILTLAGNQVQSLHHDEVERIAQIMEKTNSQIAAILTPDQQVEMQKMMKDFQANRDHDKIFPGHIKPKDSPHGGPGDNDRPPPPPGQPGPPPNPGP